MALACDLIIAADNAVFALPEPRVGAIALAGGIHRLTRQLPLKRAMGFLLTGSTFSAQDAYTLGLVNEVATSGLLDAVVERWCEEILKCAPLSVRATKEAAMRGFGEGGVEAAMQAQADYPAYRAWMGADDSREGARAFAEKRNPVWKGR
jgi:crotonobetainyl-CoA hydratase